MLHLHSSSYSSYSVLFFSSTSLLVQLYALGDLSIMFFLCHIMSHYSYIFFSYSCCFPYISLLIQLYALRTRVSTDSCSGTQPVTERHCGVSVGC